MCPRIKKDLFGNNTLSLKCEQRGADKDIWEVLLSSNNAPAISNDYFGTQPRGDLNHINHMVHQNIDEKIQQFVSQYDLDHLFALDMELNWLIRKFASFIFDKTIYLSGEIIDNIVPSLHNRFNNINEIVDIKLLLSEISDAKSAFHQPEQKEIVVKKNMMMLAMLQKASETNIENNSSRSPIEKAESYLNSYLISNVKYCHNESLVYLLCKQRKNQTVIRETISRLEREAVRTKGLSLVDNDPFISTPQSNALRLADWRHISFANSLISYNLSFMFDHRFSKPFSLYRADLGIMYRWEELSDTIENLQSAFERLSGLSDILLSSTGHVLDRTKLTSAVASVLVFVYYRLNGKFGKKSIINKAIDYLLSNQEYHKSITVTAMAVHAIAMAKLPDSQEFLTKAKDWLLKKQSKYGYWYQPGENPDYTTVLVLDALELAAGGDKVTFAISEHSKDKPAQYLIQEEQPSSLNIKNGGVVLNIYGDVNQNKLKSFPKKNTKPKNITNEETEKYSKPSVLWEDHKKAVFIITKDGKILFQFADDTSIMLGFERKNHPPKLLQIFCDNPELSAEIIRKALDTPDSVSHRVASCNELIQRELMKKGFTKCPVGFTFIESTGRKGFYRSKIPVYSLDNYDRMTRLAEEEYVNDRNFKFRDD